MNKYRCRGCGHEDVREFFDMGKMPLAGGFLSNLDDVAVEKLYPLEVHVCMKCGLVQIVEPVDPKILFWDYCFSSSTVGPLVKHFEDYARWLKGEFAPKSLVEIGCNDGILLGPLQTLGINAIGVDVSDNITELARERGFDVETGFFDPIMAEKIGERVGKVDMVSGSNCFAHNEHPEVILEAARLILKPTGKLCLEFMYAGDLLEQLQWDTLYHEHLTFYSLGTLTVLLERFGFHVIHAEHLSMHGGSLRIVASMRPERTSEKMREIQNYESEKGLNDAQTWMDFGTRANRKIAVVKDTLGRLSCDADIWAYGAAGKATLWLNACGMNYLGAVADSSPLRAGKFMPGTHTPIVFPDELKKRPPDFVFISAWNYAEVITKKEDWFKGIWLTPLPDLCFF